MKVLLIIFLAPMVLFLGIGVTAFYAVTSAAPASADLHARLCAKIDCEAN